MDNKPKLSSFSSIFEGAINDYKDRFKSIVVFSALSLAAGLVVIIPIIISILIGVFLSPIVGIIIGFIGLLAFIVAASVVSGAFMYAMKDNAGLKESFMFIKKNIWSFIWIAFLISFVIMTGTFALIIPGIILSIFLNFSLLVFADEGLKGTKALARSTEYVSGYFWAVLGRSILYSLIVFAAGMLVSTIGWVLSLIHPFLANTAQSLFNIFVVTPVSLCFSWRLYKDLKNIRTDVSSDKSAPDTGWVKAFIIVGIAIVAALTILAVVFLPNIIKRIEKAVEESRIADETHDLSVVSGMESLGMAMNIANKGVDVIDCVPGKIYKSNEGSDAIDGTGWIPINFNKAPGGSPISTLPQENRKEYYYSFSCDPELETYELNGVMLSDKYGEKMVNDEGSNDDLYEVGTDLDLIK